MPGCSVMVGKKAALATPMLAFAAAIARTLDRPGLADRAVAGGDKQGLGVVDLLRQRPAIRQPELLARLKAAGLSEAIFLSTCDRSEVQAVAADPEAAVAAVRQAFAGQARVPEEEVAAQS